MIEQRSEPRTHTHLFGRIVFGRDRSVAGFFTFTHEAHRDLGRA